MAASQHLSLAFPRDSARCLCYSQLAAAPPWSSQGGGAAGWAGGGQGTGRPVAVQQEEMLSSALAVTGQEPLVY